MENKLIEIAIPTYNRASYLKDLLDCISKNFDKHPNIINDYKIVVYDNASTDDTEQICKNFKYDLTYMKNSQNFGMTYNLNQGYAKAKAKYIWEIGDDELLTDNALYNTACDLKKYNPKLLIHWNLNKQFTWFKNLYKFNSYANLIKFTSKKRRSIIEHSLISMNVLSSELFDENIANEKEQTFYGEIYGILNKLDKEGDSRPIIVDSRKGIYTRCVGTPKEHDFPSDLSNYHEELTQWIEQKFNVKSIRIMRKVVKILGIKCSFRTIKKN